MTTGTGMWPSAGTAVNGVKKALHAAIATALAADDQVQVSFGFPFPPEQRDVVSVTAVRMVPERELISPNRRREAVVEVDVFLASWRPDPDEQLTHDRAFALLDVIDQHLRTDPTLDGAALWCLCGSVESDGATTEEEAGTGRLTEVAATYYATVVITK